MIRPPCPPTPPGPARPGAHPTPRLAALALGALALALPAAAPAQDDAGTSTKDNPVEVSFTNGAPDPIGIDNCVTEVGKTRIIELTDDSASTDTRDPEYRLYYYLGGEPCFVDDGIDACPGLGTAEDDAACGCFEARPQSSFSFDLTDLGVGDLCADGAPDSVTFIGQIVFPDDGTNDEVTYEGTDGVTVTFDRVRPGRPLDQPRLAPGENALIVRVDGLSDDVARYEVCVRPYTGVSGASPATGASNEELRGDFASALCRSTEQFGGDGYRFEGLENYVNYEVVYAAIDAAGNRGPNSPSAVETPVPQLDFAELYTQRLGGQTGEQGGCATTPGRAPAAPLLLAIPLLALAIRARRAHHGDRS